MLPGIFRETIGDGLRGLGRLTFAGLIAALIVLIPAIWFDYREFDIAVILFVAGFVFGFGSGLAAAPLAALLVLLPPILSAIPEDPWLGLLEVFFFCLYAGVGATGAGLGGLVKLGADGLGAARRGIRRIDRYSTAPPVGLGKPDPSSAAPIEPS